MDNSMRDIFFIIKGSYTKGVEPSFFNKATESVYHIGGYDPESEDTQEWYMLIDTRTYICNRASSDFNRVIDGVYTLIKKYKGNLDRYVNTMNSIRKSTPSVRCLYEELYKTYGEYYSAEVKEMEDLAYSELREEKPFHKNRKLVAKVKTNTSVVMEKSEKVIDTTPKGLAKPKARIGIKKLQMK